MFTKLLHTSCNVCFVRPYSCTKAFLQSNSLLLRTKVKIKELEQRLLSEHLQVFLQLAGVLLGSQLAHQILYLSS